MHLTILNKKLFFSLQSQSWLSKSSYKLQQKVPSQLPNTNFTQSFKKQTKNLQTILKAPMIFGAFGLNFFVYGALSQILSMVNALQMVIVCNVFQILFPANVQFFFNTIMPIATFDFLPTDITTEKLFEFDYDHHKPFN